MSLHCVGKLFDLGRLVQLGLDQMLIWAHLHLLSWIEWLRDFLPLLLPSVAIG